MSQNLSNSHEIASKKTKNDGKQNLHSPFTLIDSSGLPKTAIACGMGRGHSS